MKLRAPFIALTLGLSLVGCAHDPYEDAQKQDTPEAYQRYLEKNPEDRGADVARTRLAELRFAEARKAHTILGYKRFLEDFPQSEQAPDAQKLLEGLRFGAAEQADTVQAYDDFLRQHPNGVHAAQARAKLEALAWRDAKAAHTAASMRGFLGRFPESKHRGEAEQIADDLTFAEDAKRGPAGLSEYLEKSTVGTHRDEARARLLAQEAQARADAGDLVGALELAKRLTGPQAATLSAALAQRQLDEVAAQLDARALRTFAVAHPGPFAARALELAKAIERDPKGVQKLRAQVAHLDPAEFGLPIDELIHALDASDPRVRWMAASELGGLGAMKGFDRLLEVATDSRFEELRVRSFTALSQIVARLGPSATASEVRRQLESLRKMANSPHIYLKIALLEDLNGEVRAAAADYQHCLRGDDADLLALRRLLTLQHALHQTFPAAITARRLATTLDEAAREHGQTDDGGDPPLLAARWFCGAAHDAQVALDALQAIPAAAAKEFPDDLADFIRKAHDTARLTRARLSDAEALARAQHAGFSRCEDDEVAPRLAEGVKARLAAVAALAGSRDPLAQWPLELAARQDPAASVRHAASLAAAALAPAPVEASRTDK